VALGVIAFLQGGCDLTAGPEDSLEAPPPVGEALFTSLGPSVTGIDFRNTIVPTAELNVFTYRNFYNGGGVALGDLTGDGLPEIVLTANQEGNRLYLNEGDFRFRDITRVAGFTGEGDWATGVTLADVDGNGLLDIYVSYAGQVEPERRRNELFLHQGLTEQGIPVFREAAREYGLDDEGYSIHAAFFDYDGDSDLDVYVVNNAPTPISSLTLDNIRLVRDPYGGDKLLRNDGGSFTDVSEEAGIYGSEIGFGLGVAISDVNGDRRPDIYVSNDFFERDYLYLNNGDGTFTESIDSAMPSISYSSMGLDAADIDNDGHPEIYVTDMLPEDDFRLKMTAAFETWEQYQAKLEGDYHHQVMRNTLQLNNGDGTFSDIGRMAGVSRTDWSWSALFADFDLDGLKDLYVTNGMARDVTSQDYLGYLVTEQRAGSARMGETADFLALTEAMSSTPLANYAFRNVDGMRFENASERWGLAAPGFSSGAAFGDLDGDGAQDLVVNNVDDDAVVYRNNARLLSDHRYLAVELVGEDPNVFAVGSRVRMDDGERFLYQELFPSRGYQSSVDHVLVFGVGAKEVVPSLEVEWPDGRISVVSDVATNDRIVLYQSDATSSEEVEELPRHPIFEQVPEAWVPFVHVENDFVDFHREPLAPKLLSREGPYAAVGDVDGDGLQDLFVGGAKEQPGALLIQRAQGGFTVSPQAALELDQISEDLGAAFLDADGDGDQDLYVVSGGSEFSRLAPALQDRLYLNDGRGDLRKSTAGIPRMDLSGSRIRPRDIDGDGDVDLFVAGRLVPARYGAPAPSLLLVNDGSGRFSDATERLAPEFADLGMVTDGVWTDVDGDAREDLVVVGEWMAVEVFLSQDDGSLRRARIPGLEGHRGWWNRVVAADFNGDGRDDLVVGNLGLNTHLRASFDDPVRMYVKDLDRNGFAEQILTTSREGLESPIALRDDLTSVLPFLRRRFTNFEDYARGALGDVFTEEELAGAIVQQANTFASSLALNNGDGSFTMVPLPARAQMAPIYGIQADDFDGDGQLDLLVAGNFGGVEPDFGRMAAGYGSLLLGDGTGSFRALTARESGFFVPGEARDIVRIETPRGPLFCVLRNDDRPLLFRMMGRAD
jgi:hypothetical protein